MGTRGPKPRKEVWRTFTSNFPPEIIGQIEQIAARQGRHANELIIELMREYLQTRKPMENNMTMEKWFDAEGDEKHIPHFAVTPAVNDKHSVWVDYGRNDCTSKERLELIERFYGLAYTLEKIEAVDRVKQNKKEWSVHQ